MCDGVHMTVDGVLIFVLVQKSIYLQNELGIPAYNTTSLVCQVSWSCQQSSFFTRTLTSYFTTFSL